jgi:ring-1,2-phenylacetyl-CoA epoxidase subunit PaaD
VVTDVDTRAREVVEGVEDPELPYVTIGDLGMVRDVQADGTQITVKLTPTYTGCPATEQIRDDVCVALADAGYDADVSFVLSPPWTTDWITEIGREKLTKAGIAPPHQAGDGHETRLDLPVACPRCGSRRTKRYGDFGSTACKTNFVCESCREPFELFKAL